MVVVQGPVGRALGSGKNYTPHIRVRVHSVLSSSFDEVRRGSCCWRRAVDQCHPLRRQLDGRVHLLESAEALVAAPAASSAAPQPCDGSSWGSLQRSSMMVGIAASLSRWVMITSGKRQGNYLQTRDRASSKHQGERVT